MVLPPGLAPGPRPHPGLTGYKPAVLLYTTGGKRAATGNCTRFSRLQGGHITLLCFRGEKSGTSGWTRTITVPLNRRVDYCYPTLVCGVLLRGFAPRFPGHQPGVLLVGRQEESGGRRRACSPSRCRLAALSRRSRLACPVHLPESGSRRWTRTIIAGFKVRSPTVGRHG